MRQFTWIIPLVLGATSAVAAPVTVSVADRAGSYVTNLPVSAASPWSSFPPFSALTDDSGSATFDLPIGTWRLSVDGAEVRSRGFNSNSELGTTLEVTSDPRNIRIVLLRRSENISIGGWVVDPEGSPISQARLTVQERNSAQPVVSTVPTDAGRFAFSLFQGVFTLKPEWIGVPSPGLILPEFWITACDQATATNLMLVAHRADRKIRGTIHAASGIPSQGIEVSASCVIGAALYRSCVSTDEAGGFTLDAFDGEWWVQSAGIEAASYVRIAGKDEVISLGPSASVQPGAAQAPPELFPIKGRMVGDDGEPLDGAMVFVVFAGIAQESGPYSAPVAVTMGEGGTFETEVPRGWWAVGMSLQTGTGNQGLEQVIRVDAPTSDLVLHLPTALLSVRGRVHSESGAAASGIQVQGVMEKNAVSYLATTYTDPAGHYSLPLSPGAWSVSSNPGGVGWLPGPSVERALLIKDTDVDVDLVGFATSAPWSVSVDVVDELGRQVLYEALNPNMGPPYDWGVRSSLPDWLPLDLPAARMPVGLRQVATRRTTAFAAPSAPLRPGAPPAVQPLSICSPEFGSEVLVSQFPMHLPSPGGSTNIVLTARTAAVPVYCSLSSPNPEIEFYGGSMTATLASGLTNYVSEASLSPEWKAVLRLFPGTWRVAAQVYRPSVQGQMEIAVSGKVLEVKSEPIAIDFGNPFKDSDGRIHAELRFVDEAGRPNAKPSATFVTVREDGGISGNLFVSPSAMAAVALPPGECKLAAGGNGIEVERRITFVTDAGAGQVYYITNPIPRSMIEGTLLDERGKPAPARLVIEGVREQGDHTYRATAVVDARGRFSLPAFPGTWLIGGGDEINEGSGYRVRHREEIIVSEQGAVVALVADPIPADYLESKWIPWRRANGARVLEAWRTRLGDSYVEGSSDLLEWRPAPEFDSTNQWVTPGEDPHRFYRIRRTLGSP